MQELLDYIRSADEVDLRIISDAIRHRQDQIRERKAQENLRKLQIGDKVTLTNVKPKYLIGTGGIIIERKGGKFIVELDDNADHRALARFGGRPVCPPQILKKVD